MRDGVPIADLAIAASNLQLATAKVPRVVAVSTRSGRTPRRDIHAELSSLAPGPIPDLDQAGKVLEDFTIFWTNEADPANKRQLLSLIFDGVWLDDGRVVAVQPKPSFLPFFENRREEAAGGAG